MLKESSVFVEGDGGDVTCSFMLLRNVCKLMV